MRYALLILFAYVLAGCTIRVGDVSPSDPNYNRPGVVVGQLRVTETPYHGPRYALMTCTNEDALKRQLERVLPVQALTHQAARQIRNDQIEHLTSWGCNERVVRGYPVFEWVGWYRNAAGQGFTMYRVWQTDRGVAKAFNLGLTAR
jgi:hypothetical protein